MSTRKKAGIRSILLMVPILATLTWGGIGRADSIWNKLPGGAASLYATSRGEYKIGDIITILIVESFSATNTASLDTEKETELGMQFGGFDDIFGLTHIFGRPLSVDPNFEIDAESEFEGGGSSRRSSAVTGTISGQVTEILPNGNLRIEASQTTMINGERNSVIVVGTIRPQDVSPANTVFSTQVANAEIRYAGKGPLSNVQKRGIITEFLEFIWPF
ncbi:MAG: flagellar basal body L-ring protein FlgH [Candidatus Hydrogenedentota bacterium]|nr:MAG: flagellar basal body L-ring protein FlgH [Candidatus Hydrogenedentota bacterium]